MARGAAKAKQRQARKPVAPPPKRAPRRATPRSVEDTMFFPRLRNHAKWAFAFMVLVFGLGFVFLGVGSGSSGIGDLLQGHFSELFGGGSGSSVSKLEDKVAKNPKDAHSWRLLGEQLNGKHENAAAIRAFERYVALTKRPSPDVLTTLASLHLQRASDYQTIIQNAQQETPTGNPFGPDQTSKIGKAIGTDPISSSVSTFTQTKFQRAYAGLQEHLNGAVSTYQKLAVAQPRDPIVQQELGYAASLAGKTNVAIAAYTKFLKLDPTSADAPVIRQRLKALKAQAKVKPVATPAKSGR